LLFNTYAMAQTIGYYTEEGLQKLKAELHQLRSVERKLATQAIVEARDKGDLSENAEYDAAREAQALLELRIAKLEDVIANARIIDETKIDLSKASILTTVKIKNLTNGASMKYTLVAENEADLKIGKISVDSPIGKALLGKKVGDKVDVQVPAGKVTFEVSEISI
jgi:transcription elongation factor GreA